MILNHPFSLSLLPPHLLFNHNTGSALASQMSIVFSNSEEPATDMYVAERFEHFPMLHIRTAVVEDADDLMPIFTQYSSEVAEEYGIDFLQLLVHKIVADSIIIIGAYLSGVVGNVTYNALQKSLCFHMIMLMCRRVFSS